MNTEFEIWILCILEDHIYKQMIIPGFRKKKMPDGETKMQH